jgi:hypothetical protein
MSDRPVSALGKGLASLLGAAWAALAGLLAAAAVLLLCYDFLGDSGAFNSDHLFCSALCRDILHGADLRGWHFPGAPYLFPDVFLLLGCQALAPNLVAELVGYCFVFFGLMLAVVFWLARVLGLPGRRALVAAAAGLALLLAAHVAPAYHGRTMLLGHPGNHVGAVLIGLLLLTLTARSLRCGWGPATTTAFVLAGALGIASDKLVAVQFLAPLALALFVLTRRGLLTWRQLGGQALIQAAAVVLGLVLRAALPWLGFFLLGVENDFHRPHWNDLPFMLRYLGHCIADQSLLCAFLPLFLVTAYLVAASRWPRSPKTVSASDLAGQDDLRGLVQRWRGRGDAVVLLAALTFLLCPVCNLLALFATGLGRNPAVDRYTLPCYLLPFLGTALLWHLLPGRKSRVAAIALQTFALLWVVRQAAVILPGWDPQRFAVPYPPLARALDRLVEQRGPMRGLAGYWPARYLEFLTRHHVPIVALENGGTPYFHADNPSHYLGDTSTDLALPAYRFLVVQPKNPATPAPKVLEDHFGTPAEKVVVDGDEIWLYERIESPRLDAFLRARLAERARRLVPWTAPEAPACLARPKANFTANDARGLVHLGPGQRLEVRFARPVCGPVLDFAAGAADCFRLELYRGEERQGVLAVPAISWTGATYGPPGIQSRLLPIPAEAQARGFDRIAVLATRPNPAASVAHVLVYDQDLPGLWPCARRPDRLFQARALLTPVALPPATAAPARTVPGPGQAPF